MTIYEKSPLGLAKYLTERSYSLLVKDAVLATEKKIVLTFPYGKSSEVEFKGILYKITPRIDIIMQTPCPIIKIVIPSHNIIVRYWSSEQSAVIQSLCFEFATCEMSYEIGEFEKYLEDFDSAQKLIHEHIQITMQRNMLKILKGECKNSTNVSITGKIKTVISNEFDCATNERKK